jgi:signal transduction histidine kinase
MIVRVLAVGEVKALARLIEGGTEIALIDTTAAASTFHARGLEALTREQSAAFRSVDTPSGRWPAAVTPLGQGSVRLVVAVHPSRVVGSTTTLVRSFLVALLASALLAIVIALWLSARITRPMLDLVEEGERLKSDFLANISHELRTPLTPIRGYTDILRRGRVPSRRATGYLDEIAQGAQRLERIVTLLVDVASLDAGRFQISIEDTSPAELLSAAAGRWGNVSRSHAVRVDAEQALPDVKADSGAIGKVLDELLDNAIKFSPKGGEVTLRATKVDGGVEFSVRDSGQGIERDRLKELGQAFEQIDSGDTRRFGGLGLGLNFTRGVMRAHATHLSIDSTPGEGTTCSFVLPASTLSRMGAKTARGGSRKASTRRDT